jgi:hypothetical protein
METSSNPTTAEASTTPFGHSGAMADPDQVNQGLQCCLIALKEALVFRSSKDPILLSIRLLLAMLITRLHVASGSDRLATGLIERLQPALDSFCRTNPQSSELLRALWAHLQSEWRVGLANHERDAPNEPHCKRR